MRERLICASRRALSSGPGRAIPWASEIDFRALYPPEEGGEEGEAAAEEVEGDCDCDREASFPRLHPNGSLPILNPGSWVMKLLAILQLPKAKKDSL